MEFQEALNKIQQGELNPVYFLNGDEPVLKHQLIHAIQERLESSSEIDQSTYSLTDTTMDEVLDEANAFSFFADYRLILVERAEFVGGTTDIKLSDDQKKTLMKYIEHPNEATIIIFFNEIGQMDRRLKLTKVLEKAKAIVDVTQIDDQQVVRYVRNYLDAHEVNITAEAFENLLQRTNYHLSSALNEAAKLKLYAGDGETIDLSIVQYLITRTLESNVFELTNAMNRQDLAKAIEIYQDLLLMKNDPIRLHSIIVSNYRLILQSMLLSSLGWSQSDIANTLKVHPYRVKLALQSSGHQSLDRMMNFFNQLVDVDFQLKSGIGNQETHFYVLLSLMNSL